MLNQWEINKMSNPEHLLFLKRGVDAWNAWRNEHPDIRPDLKRAVLENLDLYGYNLNSSNLRWVNFSETNLRYCDLSSSDLSHADFRNADLTGTDLSNCVLYDCDFQNTALDEAILDWSLTNRHTSFPEFSSELGADLNAE
jgi:uncharacterized protein YjbI with pentapeptide repeats